jgi:hypothetical protein
MTEAPPLPGAGAAAERGREAGAGKGPRRRRRVKEAQEERLAGAVGERHFHCRRGLLVCARSGTSRRRWCSALAR